MPEPVQEEPQEVEVVHLSKNEEEDIVEEDERIPPLGGQQRCGISRGVNPPFHITDL